MQLHKKFSVRKKKTMYSGVSDTPSDAAFLESSTGFIEAFVVVFGLCS